MVAQKNRLKTVLLSTRYICLDKYSQIYIHKYLFYISGPMTNTRTYGQAHIKMEEGHPRSILCQTIFNSPKVVLDKKIFLSFSYKYIGKNWLHSFWRINIIWTITNLQPMAQVNHNNPPSAYGSGEPQ